MKADELVKDQWYWCDHPNVFRHVKFVEIVQHHSTLKGLAYVEFNTDEMNLGGWYIHPSRLHTPKNESRIP